jgi:hypothetical protein
MNGLIKRTVPEREEPSPKEQHGFEREEEGKAI